MAKNIPRSARNVKASEGLITFKTAGPKSKPVTSWPSITGNPKRTKKAPMGQATARMMRRFIIRWSVSIMTFPSLQVKMVKMPAVACQEINKLNN
jgi:hypothetical protein